VKLTHAWNLTPRQAIQLQLKLRQQVKYRRDPKSPIRYVAGADISWDPATKLGFSGVIVYDYPGLREVDRAWAKGRASFPYIPGLLSFREGPLLLAAFERLKVKPDLVFLDGHGLAHPRRFGIACHMGLLLDCPAIGCAKSRLLGEFKLPGQRPGTSQPLQDHGDVIGSVLRTKAHTQPIFISIGHQISLKEAVRWSMGCCDGFRIPKPTREADRFVGNLRKEHLTTMTAKLETYAMA
jgi:deoxyribonuclease V